MKGLKEFLELLAKDKNLKAEVEKVKDDTAKIVEIAMEHGFEFTEDEFNDVKMKVVAGGNGADDAAKIIGTFGQLALGAFDIYTRNNRYGW